MSTDTTPADNQQLAGIVARIMARQPWPSSWPPATAAEQGDPQWAGPSLPHPSEATSEEERQDLDEKWDDYHHGIEPNQEQIEA